jgi:DNA-binding NtrC family response regulator
MSEARARSLTVLHSVDPDLDGRVLAIGKGICVGRVEQDGVDVAVADRLLSRKHATIKPLGTSEVYEIIDHESRNGSFVDGVRVQRSHLTEGTIVRLGINVFELTADPIDAAKAESTALGGDRDALVGRSVPFLKMRARLDDVASGDEPVVFVGEAGTGKSVAASYVHKMYACEGPLVAVSCGSGPTLGEMDLFGGKRPDGEMIDGYCATANNGCLLFEEVDLIDAELQPKLLEMLKTGKYTPVGTDEPRELNARVLASTGADLGAAVEAGAFEEDLFRALAKTEIQMPALRMRRSDIPSLAQHFLRIEEPKRTFDWSATFLEKLLLYDWPLNVRELRTVMRRLTMVEDEVTTLRSAHLPKEIRKRVRMPSEDALRASAIQVHVVPSRDELRKMLERHSGDVQRIAEHYAKDRRHVYRWLTRHDLSAGDFRKRS